jgi:hypothetical protein
MAFAYTDHFYHLPVPDRLEFDDGLIEPVPIPSCCACNSSAETGGAGSSAPIPLRPRMSTIARAAISGSVSGKGATMR